MNLVSSLLLASVMFFSPSNDECKKIKNSTPEDNWMSVVLAEAYTVKTLRGQILDTNNHPISEAQIELIRLSEKGEGTVICVCRTQESGRFRFKKAKEGRYEIRVSLKGYDRTLVRVTVSKDAGANGEIEIPLKPGS